MEMTLWIGDDEYTATIEWTSEPVTLDSGRVVYEVVNWRVSEIDGKAVESGWEKYLDESEVIAKIEDWEA